MPDFISIANSQVDPESPVTSELMTALRDNPLAIAEGDQTAPRVTSKGMSFTRSIQRFVSSQAGENSLLNIGIGDSREQLIRVDISWNKYVIDISEVASGDFNVQCFGDNYFVEEASGSLESGNSRVRLQGSNDLSSWDDLQDIGSYTAGALGTATILARNTVVWDGRGVAGKYSAASYRYFRVFAGGDGDHDIVADFYLMAMGD